MAAAENKCRALGHMDGCFKSSTATLLTVYSLLRRRSQQRTFADAICRFCVWMEPSLSLGDLISTLVEGSWTLLKTFDPCCLRNCLTQARYSRRQILRIDHQSAPAAAVRGSAFHESSETAGLVSGPSETETVTEPARRVGRVSYSSAYGADI